MFSTVWMKILEKRPKSYDRRMDKISRGRIRSIKEQVAGCVPTGSHVLEIGCGTGELAGLMIRRGCTVEAFDLNPFMVKAAIERIETENLKGKFSVKESGVEQMDGFSSEQYDAVVSTLVFSELNVDERRFALKHAARVLKPKGRLIIADEVVPRRKVHRLIHALARLPMLAATYIVSGQSTQPINNLAGEIADAKIIVEKEERRQADSFAIVVGFKKERENE